MHLWYMIANIALACGTNVGGVRHLQVIDINDIISIPSASASVINSEISLKAGVTPAVISFPPHAGDFAQKVKEADSGQIIQSTIRVDIPKDAVEIGQWANLNSEREVVALYMDENGVVCIVGSLERPLAMKVNRATGRKAADNNKFDITLEGIADHYAYYYNMFELLPAGERKVYSAGYTFGYQRT